MSVEALVGETDLESSLIGFAQLVNENTKLDRLLSNWNKVIRIQNRTQPDYFLLTVDECKVSNLSKGTGECEYSILLRGEETVLTRIFSGDLNPAQAYLNGELEVFGDDRDQVKLDAICMVLWGF